MKSTTAPASLFITLLRQNVCNIANNMDNFSSLVRWDAFKYSKLLDVSFETVWGSQEPIQSTQTISYVLRPSPKTFAPTSKLTLAKKARYWIIWTSKQPTGCLKWVLFSGKVEIVAFLAKGLLMRITKIIYIPSLSHVGPLWYVKF